MRVATWPASMCLRSNRRCSAKWLSCANGVGSVHRVVVASISIQTGPLPRNPLTRGWFEKRVADGQGLTFPVLIVVRHLSGHVQGPPISGKVATVGAIPGAKQGGSPCADRYHLLAIALRPVRSGPRVGAPERVAFRDLKRVGTRDCTCFAAQWLAYALPCRRFARTLTSANARLGAELDRYAFLMVGSHHQLPAGLPAHSHQVETSTRHQHDPIELPAGVDTASSRWADAQAEDPMMIHLVSPMFMAGEVLLGFSLTVFIGALIATVADTYRSRQR